MRGFCNGHRSQGVGGELGRGWVNSAVGWKVNGSRGHPQRKLAECAVMGPGQRTPREQQLGACAHENNQTSYRGKRATSRIHIQLECEKWPPGPTVITVIMTLDDLQWEIVPLREDQASVKGNSLWTGWGYRIHLNPEMKIKKCTVGKSKLTSQSNNRKKGSYAQFSDVP